MLVAEGVAKWYGSGRARVVALEEASLTLAPGERVGVVGRSGSGKSTLAQILSLVLRPDRGRVSVDGEVVSRWGVDAPKHLRRQVQLMWQSPRLSTDPRMRLWEIILEPLAIHGLLPRRPAERHAILEEWRERVGLTPELLERYPHEVSEGQLQRACLARALIVHPRYLICDEISSMLDVSTQAALLATIAQEQAQRPMGVLLISHDTVLVHYWCTRAVRLEKGKTMPLS
ncbi:MAG: dipeptide/oligopeptide/nickel ABC transporter ATP-binding protein [Dehalococcoidia bacterium]|nr:dipeptide/oligopeptide/nickel ABC transporter ATP-binding protein [Dehalococcoidia bacterium]MDW8119713.1 dipeptide/oligopeptide/nickel ABC transporter ATP-binding protein [Chloroflexota bacterium]